MVTFILICFVVTILASVAKVVYEAKQDKKKEKVESIGALDYVGGPTSSFITPEEVDRFQKLAGIKQHDSQKGTIDLANVDLANVVTKVKPAPKKKTKNKV
jgi:hypothetical protein